jgi:hypothetical protein
MPLGRLVVEIVSGGGPAMLIERFVDEECAAESET